MRGGRARRCAASPLGPARPEDRDLFTTWFRRDRLVLSWIIGSIFEQFIPQIIGVSCAKDAWNKLASAYASSSKADLNY